MCWRTIRPPRETVQPAPTSHLTDCHSHSDTVTTPTTRLTITNSITATQPIAPSRPPSNGGSGAYCEDGGTSEGTRAATSSLASGSGYLSGGPSRAQAGKEPYSFFPSRRPHHSRKVAMASWYSGERRPDRKSHLPASLVSFIASSTWP